MTYNPTITSLRISKNYGYVFGGSTGAISILTEKYDDVANTWATKANLNTGRRSTTRFLLNGYGYCVAGDTNPAVGTISAVVEKYDDVANTWTPKQSVGTARRDLSGFELTGYGYCAGGYVAASSAITEKYDDVANTWTAKTSMNTARREFEGFSVNGYGYNAGGYVAVSSAITEKYDDVANTWTAVASLAIARRYLSCFTLKSYGYTAGDSNNIGAVSKYDDISNTWTVQAVTTNKTSPATFSINGYGYNAGGWLSAAPSATVQKYDDVLNTWTAKTPMTIARDGISGQGLGIGAINDGIQNPILYDISKRVNKETIPTDQTASRAIDGTVYTNTASSNLFVTVSARCIIDTAADVANIQAFSDTAADPATAASGIVGIEGGLLGEDVSVQFSFIVRPYQKYKVVTTISAGCSATLGKWFETILK